MRMRLCSEGSGINGGIPYYGETMLLLALVTSRLSGGAVQRRHTGCVSPVPIFYDLGHATHD